MKVLQVKHLTKSDINIINVQRLLEEAPDYSLRITGGLPKKGDAKQLFVDLPPNATNADKYILGFYLDSKLIAVADIVRGYPKAETLMLGLLLLSEKYQEKGLGRNAYELIEDYCLKWPEIKKIRIGVVKTNMPVITFWKKMGFSETGEVKPFAEGSVVSEVIVLEKILVAIRI